MFYLVSFCHSFTNMSKSTHSQQAPVPFLKIRKYQSCVILRCTYLIIKQSCDASNKISKIIASQYHGRYVCNSYVSRFFFQKLLKLLGPRIMTTRTIQRQLSKAQMYTDAVFAWLLNVFRTFVLLCAL